MKTHFANLLSSPLVGAIANTLWNSLWQGLILTFTAGMTVMLTTRSTSVLRYRLLTAQLFGFAIAAGITFLHSFKDDAAVPSLAVSGHVALQQQAMHPVLTQAWKGIDQFSPTIVLIWLLIIFIKLLKFTIDLTHSYELKKSRIFSAGELWTKRFQELASGLGIKQKISFLQSGIAKVPMVLGHLKPVVLIPIGLLTSLGTAEIEAILLHELAHIARRDYLVNLLQNLLEIILFFNPAVLWVSGLIRAERENCCDDLAIRQSSDETGYIRALLNCKEYQSGIPMQAVVFFNRRDQLLNRVKRIASRRNNTLNSLEKGLLALALIIMVGLSSAFSGHSVLRPVKNSKLSPADSSAIVHEKTLMRSIIADLQKDKVVKSADDLLWFGLNDEKMMVNGKLLPDNLYREFKQKYLLQPGIGFYYGHVQMTGTGYFYSKEELER